MIRPRCGPRPTWPPRARKSTRPTARRATRPTARACLARFPALDGSKVVNGPPAAQIALVLAGKAGTAMPAWKQLSNADIAAVITYTRNSWGNHSGEAIQPAQVVAARKEQ